MANKEKLPENPPEIYEYQGLQLPDRLRSNRRVIRHTSTLAELNGATVISEAINPERVVHNYPNGIIVTLNKGDRYIDVHGNERIYGEDVEVDQQKRPPFS